MTKTKPRPITEVPAVAEATKKLTGLQHQAADLKARRDRMHTQLADLDEGIALDPIESAARQLLDGDDINISGSASKIRDELAGVGLELRVIEKAVAMARERRARAEDAASRQACEKAREAHCGAVLSVVDALRPLHEALKAEQAVRHDLEALGYSTSTLPPLTLHGLNLDDGYSQASFYLVGAVEAGYLDREGVLRDRPEAVAADLAARLPVAVGV